MRLAKEEGREGMETPTVTLPEDLIAEVLLLLPVRSLLRFKCVCKSWRSLISDPQFAKSHFDLAAAPTHRRLLDTVNDDKIESFNLDASVYDHSAMARLHLRIPHHLFFRTWGSCKGFILVHDFRDDVMIVWNPSTGTRLQFPCSHTWDESQVIGYGIGYYESTNDYLIVQIGLGFLQGEQYWLPALDVFSLRTKVSCFIWGSSSSSSTEESREVKVILAFNLIDRSLAEIPVPHDTLDLESDYLTVMGGCPSLCCESGDGNQMGQIWIMEDYKVHSSWTKAFDTPLDNYPYGYFAPTYFTKGGGACFGSMSR
ncbi:F-box/kelch-repeat protein At3g23880-like [Lotus japonicus]|uniref:F-box/kelch-repeat protein At3g23880-like n=1 Tax=Lotus japonicus TaxID=34305 RepID=UPI00258AC311|nr:F-box/kelch-repeat protein At3g23880-like [Lotus japonicus]XP_057433726.1 F-box/kelch-repeat protein At3g23880-like [Lotus japonicus]